MFTRLVRRMGSRVRLCAVASSCLAFGVVAAPSVAHAQSTLAGEFLSSLPPATITGGTCSRSGSSTFEFTVSGTAAGPYPGTFTESGHVTIGPQTEEFLPGQFRGPIVDFHADFVIDGPAGQVSGSKDLGTTTPNSNPPNVGACSWRAGEGLDITMAQIYAYPLEYTATITSGDSQFVDQGESTAQFNAYHVAIHPGANSSSMQFREWFTVSTTPVVLPVCSNGVDDDGDGGVDFPADPGCDSATDGEESPDPVVLPVPTAAGQCKDSGWMSYPHLAFKNQGDCVSYVVTHGRNEPGQNRP